MGAMVFISDYGMNAGLYIINRSMGLWGQPPD